MSLVPANNSLEPGTFFETYYLITSLGAGGMGEVLLAYDFAAARLVALKFMLEHHARNASALERMKREGEIYRALDHPNVLRLLETGTSPGVPYFLVLQYLRGTPLDAVMEEKGPLELHVAMRILEDTASALHAAHGKNIIHRDVKPHNVMIGPDGRATLFDFGVARVGDKAALTQKGSILGTMAYAAPEQRMGKPIDHRADIFGLGAIFYECLTGRRAVEGESFQELAMAETSFLKKPSQLNPKVPEVLDRISDRLLADDPAQRYQDLKSLLIELGLLRVDSPEELRQRMFGSEADRRLFDAVKAYRYGELKEASIEIERFGGMPPPALAPEILRLKADIEVDTGRPDDAVGSLELALEYEPNNYEILLDLALLLIRLGRGDDARGVLKGVPSPMRGRLLVLGLLEVLSVLPRVPGVVLGKLSRQGLAKRFHEAVLAHA